MARHTIAADDALRDRETACMCFGVVSRMAATSRELQGMPGVLQEQPLTTLVLVKGCFCW